MKTLLITILLQCFLCNSLWSQKNYNSFYKKNKQEAGIINFKISPFFFKFLLDKEDRKELKPILKKLDKISFFISPDKNPELFEELSIHLPEENYKDLMEIKEGHSTIRFKVKEHQESIDEVLMILSETDSFLIMCIDGNFSFDEVKSLINSVNMNNTVNIK